jgi:hypothetical protein
MNDLDHIWHVWINRRQHERGNEAPWEHSLYEFKSMLQFLTYGAKQIKEAFDGKLPQTHQQCSHQPVEQLKVLNTLKCSREGIDVTTCPILLSLRDTFQTELERVYPFNGKKANPDLSPDAVYDLMAKTCAWHIYAEAVGIPEGHHFAIDTSMGYLIDETDRIFWNRVHDSMATNFSDEEPE